MHSNKLITAIIPARSGSKRLKDKNIRSLFGKPLIFYTIESFLGHNEVGNVIFTSDSIEYCNLVKEAFGNQVTIIRRPKSTATDNTKVVEEIERLLIEHPDEFVSEWFMVGLPTAPFRNFDDVKRLIKYWQLKNKGCFSASKYDFPTQFAFEITENDTEHVNWRPILNKSSPMITGKTRSQDIPATYRPNGAIYITSKKYFLDRKVLYDNCDAVPISERSGYDIDTEMDFTIAEIIGKELVDGGK
jgi:CMP-N,N'-diacetyllegionaminic acid synthase